MKRSYWITLTTLLAGTLTSGCGVTHIAYQPMAGTPPAAAATLGLKVVNARPAEAGGTTATVGQIRGTYGIPSGVDDADVQAPTKSVAAATTDALKQAGVGVQDGGARTLVATIKHYWMDGMMGYKATVTVNYVLQDASGKSLWSKDVSGGAGGTNMFRAADSFTQDMMQNALTDLATKASAEFKSDAFKQALK